MNALRICSLVIVSVVLVAFSSCNKKETTPDFKNLSSYLVAYNWNLSDADFNTLVGEVTFDDKGVYTLTRTGGTVEIFSYVVDNAKENVTISNKTGTEVYHVIWDKTSKEMRWNGVTTNFMHLRYKVK
jgi:hypothetical protein